MDSHNNQNKQYLPYHYGGELTQSDLGDTAWQAVVTDGTNIVTNNTGVAPDATTPHIFALQWSGSNVLFFIDGTQVASLSTSTTTITTGSKLNGFFSVDNVGLGNNKIAYISYFYWDTTP